jgi:FkbM family methyltransferase
MPREHPNEALRDNRVVARAWVRDVARRVLHGAGVDLVRYDERHSADLRRHRILRERRIDVVVDVGANDGPYAIALRRAGFAGRIVSFEPGSSAFARLAERAAGDERWEAQRLAIGSRRGSATLRVTGNSSSSSLLALRELQVEAEPESAVVATENVEVAVLDELAVVRTGERAFLKLDVQGYELEVLRGADALLTSVQAVETELSLVPLYDGAPLLPEVVEHLLGRGFHLHGLEPVFWDPRDGAVLQLDGMFVRD